jgi:hypothetical protein
MKFVGGAWTHESRAGTFARFFEAHAGLDRPAFLERIRSPYLVIGLFDLNPRTWDQAIVVRLDKPQGLADEVVVGRSVEADVTLNCPTMSKRHARFSRGESGWSVTDLASAQGTLLDGQALESEKKTPLASARPAIGFGRDVTATFFLPERLFELLEEARARRAAGAPSPTSGPRAGLEWPAWALLQEPGMKVTTDHNLPVFTPAVGAPPPRVERPQRFRKGWRAQARELFQNPRRAAFAIAAVVLIVVCARVYLRPIAVMIFGDRHPEWFK